MYMFMFVNVPGSSAMVRSEQYVDGQCAKSNHILLVTCAEYNRCRPYSEMLTYEPLTDSAVLENTDNNIRDKSNK